MNNYSDTPIKKAVDTQTSQYTTQSRFEKDEQYRKVIISKRILLVLGVALTILIAIGVSYLIFQSRVVYFK